MFGDRNILTDYIRQFLNSKKRQSGIDQILSDETSPLVMRNSSISLRDKNLQQWSSVDLVHPVPKNSCNFVSTVAVPSLFSKTYATFHRLAWILAS